MYFITGLFLSYFFLVSFLRDNRSLWNPALLLLSLLFFLYVYCQSFLRSWAERSAHGFLCRDFSPAASFSFSKWFFSLFIMDLCY